MNTHGQNSRVWRASAYCLLFSHLFLIAGEPANGDLFDRSWYVYESENFTVYSDRPEHEVAEQIHDLELFREVVLTWIGIDEEPPRHTTNIFLFDSISNFNKIVSNTRWLGIMLPGLRANTLIINQGPATEETTYHEYAHHLMRSLHAVDYPRWFDEGFAEMVSTFKVIDDQIVIGRVPKRRLNILRFKKRMPLRKVINGEHVEHWGAVSADLFYAQSWGLTHFLHFAHKSGYERRDAQMQQFLAAVSTGTEAGEAFGQHFGITYKSMQNRMRRYFARHSLPKYRTPVSSYAVSGKYTKKPMDRDRQAYELGYLAVHFSPELATELFEGILSRDQTHARAIAGLALAKQFIGDYSEGYDAGKRAQEMAADDPVVNIELADLLNEWCLSDEPPEHCQRLKIEADRLYELAYQAAPESLEAKAHWGRTLVKRGEIDEALPLLEEAYAVAPGSAYLALNLGQVYAVTGRVNEARKLLNRAFYWSSPEHQTHTVAETALARLDEFSANTLETDHAQPSAAQ